MGSALLGDPERLESILKALVLNVPLPISCKIRLIPPSQDLTFLETTALTVHCRFTHEKPRDPGHWEIFDFISSKMKIPLIANGDLFTKHDIQRLQDLNIVDSFMIARAAQWNPSVFRKEGLLPIEDVMLEYLNLAQRYDIHYKNTKYALIHMEVEGRDGISLRAALGGAKSMEDMKSILEQFRRDRKNND
jgi:tRNA-dihydrouridine synthase 2